MVSTGIFIFGLFVTIIVVGSIALILWAAVEDGRKQSEVSGAEEL
jgi:hypothetical protein